MHWILIKETKNESGRIKEIKCSNCGHRETERIYSTPSRCYVCEEWDEDFERLIQGEAASGFGGEG